MSKVGAEKRKQISTRTRFEIFKRDGFVCQYCGSHPPSVILEVDHILPVKLGGGNDRGNLVTACEGCNRGKSAVPLSSIPISLAEQAARIAESERQIKGYQKVIASQRDRLNEETWAIVRVGWSDAVEWPKRDMMTIRRFLEALGFHAVLDAMELSVSKFPWLGNSCWRYFCGICWRRIKEAQQNV